MPHEVMQTLPNLIATEVASRVAACLSHCMEERTGGGNVHKGEITFDHLQVAEFSVRHLELIPLTLKKINNGIVRVKVNICLTIKQRELKTHHRSL